MLCILAVATAAGNVRLTAATASGFDEYIRHIEAQMDSDAQAQRVRVLDRLPEERARVMKGDVAAIPFAQRASGQGASINITGGLINHWFGAAFIPRATVDDVRAVLQDYDSYSRIYAPDVTESRLLKRNGDEFDIFLRLHRQIRVKVLFGYSFPVEFNTTYHVPYSMRAGVLHVRSISTRIAQVKDPKNSHTAEYPPGDDDGYLWRLNSYWRIYETNAPERGVILECEAVSLSRSVPSFLQGVITYFTTNFPEESMRTTLDATRRAVQARAAQP